ncbi:MAG: hypothetical protein O3A00_02755 [Planctomycetota bacterium]|nr:hypothetical protein [Planctomycetota bacterium]
MAGRRLEMRKMHEAAEALGIDETAPKKKTAAKRKAAAPRAKRAVKAAPRKKLMWVIYTGSMREEARFEYDQKEAADEKLVALRARGKKLYFMQPLKEAITASDPAEDAADDSNDSDDAAT